MTKEQYEKLKEYIEAVATKQAAYATGNGWVNAKLRKNEVEKELDALMGFGEKE